MIQRTWFRMIVASLVLACEGLCCQALEPAVGPNEDSMAEVAHEVARLRDDLQSLHADVKQLLQLLEESRSGVEPPDKGQLSQDPKLESAAPAEDVSEIPSGVLDDSQLPSSFRDFSLQEALVWAAKTGDQSKTSEEALLNRTLAIHWQYWDLWTSYQMLAAAQDAKQATIELWRHAVARTKIGDAPPEVEAQSRALYAQFQAEVHGLLHGSPIPGRDPRGLYQRERTLRNTLGLSAQDGVLLRPTDEPSVEQLRSGWSRMLEDALEHNLDVRQQKQEVQRSEMELEAIQNGTRAPQSLNDYYQLLGMKLYVDANKDSGESDSGESDSGESDSGESDSGEGDSEEDESGSGEPWKQAKGLEFTPSSLGRRRALANLQNAELEVAKKREVLNELESALANELSLVWRQMEPAYLALENFREQWRANEEEAKIYRDNIEQGVGAATQLFDRLTRSEERTARSQAAYYQAVASYNKAIARLYYLTGRLDESRPAKSDDDTSSENRSEK